VDFDYATGFRVLIWTVIAGGLIGVGETIKGNAPKKSARAIMAWPLIGLGIAFFFLAGAEILVNFFGGLLLEAWSLVKWIRGLF
jgi:hypothetical protein